MEDFITYPTQKGQVTLPKSLRDSFGINQFTPVHINRTKSAIIIRADKRPSIIDLAGTIKAKNGQDVLKAREYMETHYHRV